MKEIKRTITREEITGYEAFDGSVFHDQQECIKYEQSARAVAKRAAWSYLVAERSSYELFRDDDYTSFLTFDVPNLSAFIAIAHWLELVGAWGRESFTSDYIGQRVGFMNYDGDINFFGSKKCMVDNYMSEIEKLWADAEPAQG